MQIEPYASHHRDAIVSLSLRAWTPVFDSIQIKQAFSNLQTALKSVDGTISLKISVFGVAN